MNYDRLDNDELLRLALEAVNGGRDADGVVMLKTLLEREPGHVFGAYLLAAQHAQLGMLDRAETGFRAVVAQAPELAIARFQLGQLLLVKGALADARELLAPLLDESGALAAYARGLLAAAAEDVRGAIAALDSGLGLPQDIPALAADMQQLRARLLAIAEQGAAAPPVAGSPAIAPAMLLANYGRGD